MSLLHLFKPLLDCVFEGMFSFLLVVYRPLVRPEYRTQTDRQAVPNIIPTPKLFFCSGGKNLIEYPNSSRLSII